MRGEGGGERETVKNTLDNDFKEIRGKERDWNNRKKEREPKRNVTIVVPTLRGLVGPYFCLRCMRPGISFSAITSSFLPQSARERSAKIR